MDRPTEDEKARYNSDWYDGKRKALDSFASLPPGPKYHAHIPASSRMKHPVNTDYAPESSTAGQEQSETVGYSALLEDSGSMGRSSESSAGSAYRDAGFEAYHRNWGRYYIERDAQTKAPHSSNNTHDSEDNAHHDTQFTLEGKDGPRKSSS